MSTGIKHVTSHGSSSCFEKGPCIHNKWFGTALLVGSVVIFGFFAAFGGVGLFSSTNSLPDWFASAIGTIGSNGCWAMFLWGCFFGAAGGVTGIVLIVKAHIRERVNRRDASGWTPLHHAIKNQNQNEIKKLIDQGADVNMETQDGHPLLHALSFNSCEIALTLLSSPDIDLEKRDSNGRTAFFSHKPPIIWCLIAQNKADVNVQDDRGYTPLHLAVDNPEILQLLLTHPKINVNIQNNNGDTPLHRAARLPRGNIQMLLDKGANITILNNRNEKASEILAERSPLFKLV